MIKIELESKDCEFIFWTLRMESYNQKDKKVKKEIMSLANKFKI